MPSKKVAFTLAEVLITLGIIGVVAAVTLPVLIQNHQKSVISTKLKKFNSMMAQAVVRSEDENGSVESWLTHNETWDLLDLENFFTTYLAPFLQYTKIEKTDSTHLTVYLADGTFFTLRKGWCVDITYYANKKGKLGKGAFVFLICGSGGDNMCDGKHYCSYHPTVYSTREQRLESCKNNPYYCSGLLEWDNWEFKDDYPWRF